MKILYSYIKKLVPALKADAKEVGEILTMTGFMLDGFEKVEYQGKKDYLMSFEIRNNRPDCLSIIGLAREVAAYYGLSIKTPVIKNLKFGKNKISINVNEKKLIKRIIAVEMENIKNSESPKWLKSLLNFYQINSVNCLVDLSNYAMLMTGQPSHIFDKEKIKGSLSWSLNKKHEKIITLDKSEIKINNSTLIVEDDNEILALAGIVGGDKARIELKTKSIILEMATYDNAIISKNSRKLNIITEAGNRLSKELDPNNLDFSIRFLISIIQENCKGDISSRLFDYYPKKEKAKVILFDPSLPTAFAGVKITVQKSEKILKNLGCKVSKKGKKLLVVLPQNRTDLSIEEDIIEEVIRIFGYYNIKSDNAPALEVVKNITPISFYLQEKVRDILQANGFDEVLSSPLVSKAINKETKYKNMGLVIMQNSVNEEFPELRQSIATGLVLQIRNYLKLGVENIKIFEIGKVFGEENKKYLENNSLGILINSDKKEIYKIKEAIENLLRSLGIENIKYFPAKQKPEIANQFSIFDIIINKENVGIIYKLNSQENKNIYFAEINLDELTTILEKNHGQATIEITQKLVTLDANVELEKEESIYDFLESVQEKINKKNIMAIRIFDVFPLGSKIRYTIRVSYEGLSDQEAKKFHMAIFGLTDVKQ
ncbi:phenylalanine--tRNA ligase subunit beta [Patescibacteria group bacterium]|nr:phenylalanine--tRNA ligase subunit beta [Patescibacteria group bacterium]